MASHDEISIREKALIEISSVYEDLLEKYNNLIKDAKEKHGEENKEDGN